MIMDARETDRSAPRAKPLSNEALSLISICLDSESMEQLRHFIESPGLISLQGELQSYLTEQDDSLLDWVNESAPDICLIDFDKNRRSATLTAERIHEKLPGTSLFALSGNSQSSLIIDAMRCGCNEYLVKPLNRDELLEAVARVSGRKKEKREQTGGQLLVFLGAKGGVGVTTLATHLGGLLAKFYSRKTVLVDLHPDFGDAGLYLGLTQQRYHFYELAESTERLDADLLQSFLGHHPSGLDLLHSPDGLEPGRQVSPEAIAQTIDFLRLRYDFIIVDCPPGLSEQNVQMLRQCDQLYLVTVPEVSPLRNAARLLDYLNRTEFPQEKVKVVLNRYLKRAAIGDDQIEKALRRNISWKIPNQYGHVVKAIHGGDPTSQVSSSDVARSMMGWAESLGGKPAAGHETKKVNKGIRGLWGR
jgi:pilus assembly protein CpaE